MAAGYMVLLYLLSHWSIEITFCAGFLLVLLSGLNVATRGRGDFEEILDDLSGEFFTLSSFFAGEGCSFIPLTGGATLGNGLGWIFFSGILFSLTVRFYSCATRGKGAKFLFGISLAATVSTDECLCTF